MKKQEKKRRKLERQRMATISKLKEAQKPLLTTPDDTAGSTGIQQVELCHDEVEIPAISGAGGSLLRGQQTQSLSEADHVGEETLDSGDNEMTASEPAVLVDYELPGGRARLDWDTDLIRRLFGEID